MMRAMKVYEVGGAVRDALLGLPVKERDWVVVGASADELLLEALGVGTGDETAIRDAARDGEAPSLRLHRELLGGNHVPDDVRAIERDIGRVALVVRQQQIRDGELAYLRDRRELRLRLRIDLRVREQLVDRRAFTHQIDLPADCLPIERASAERH